MTKDTNHSTK